MLDRLVERRSRYGIGFRKDGIVAKGGNPLWYVDRQSPQAATIDTMINNAVTGGSNPDDPIWKLTPFIDHPGVYSGRPYRFEWEREWRAAGDVDSSRTRWRPVHPRGAARPGSTILRRRPHRELRPRL